MAMADDEQSSSSVSSVDMPGLLVNALDLEDENELDEKSQVSRFTQRSNRAAATTFREFLQQKDESEEFENFSIPKLAKLLSEFYTNGKRRDGEAFKISSLESFRYSLSRYLKAPPFLKNFDIMKDAEFAEANKCFNAARKELKKIGKGITTHFQIIGEFDRQKLYSSVHLNPTVSAWGLANKVQFDIRLYFCRSGVENMHKLQRTAFEVKEDYQGNKHVVQVKGKKARQGASEKSKGLPPLTMPEERGSPYCPVKSFEIYLSKLNTSCDRLWQYPKEPTSLDDRCWFASRAMGHNTLSGFMPRLSKLCGLSKIYTNHSIKVTGNAMLSRLNLSLAASHIMCVSGNKTTPVRNWKKQSTDYGLGGSFRPLMPKLEIQEPTQPIVLQLQSSDPSILNAAPVMGQKIPVYLQPSSSLGTGMCAAPGIQPVQIASIPRPIAPKSPQKPITPIALAPLYPRNNTLRQLMTSANPVTPMSPVIFVTSACVRNSICSVTMANSSPPSVIDTTSSIVPVFSNPYVVKPIASAASNVPMDLGNIANEQCSVKTEVSEISSADSSDVAINLSIHGFSDKDRSVVDSFDSSLQKCESSPSSVVPTGLYFRTPTGDLQSSEVKLLIEPPKCPENLVVKTEPKDNDDVSSDTVEMKDTAVIVSTESVGVSTNPVSFMAIQNNSSLDTTQCASRSRLKAILTSSDVSRNQTSQIESKSRKIGKDNFSNDVSTTNYATTSTQVQTKDLEEHFKIDSCKSPGVMNKTCDMCTQTDPEVDFPTPDKGTDVSTCTQMDTPSKQGSPQCDTNTKPSPQRSVESSIKCVPIKDGCDTAEKAIILVSSKDGKESSAIQSPEPDGMHSLHDDSGTKRMGEGDSGAEYTGSSDACSGDESQDDLQPLPDDNLLEVTCGQLKAFLHRDKFYCPGIHRECIEIQGGALITPKKFSVMGEKAKLKDWKNAVRINGVQLRKYIDSGTLTFANHDSVCTGRCVARAAGARGPNSTKLEILENFKLESGLGDGNYLSTVSNGSYMQLQEHSGVAKIEWNQDDENEDEDEERDIKPDVNQLQLQMLQAQNQGAKVTSGVSAPPPKTYIVRQSNHIPDPVATLEPDMAELTEEDIEDRTLWKGIVELGLVDEFFREIKAALDVLKNGMIHRHVPYSDSRRISVIVKQLGLMQKLKYKLEAHQTDMERQRMKLDREMEELQRKVREYEHKKEMLKRKSACFEQLLDITLKEEGVPPAKQICTNPVPTSMIVYPNQTVIAQNKGVVERSMKSLLPSKSVVSDTSAAAGSPNQSFTKIKTSFRKPKIQDVVSGVEAIDQAMADGSSGFHVSESGSAIDQAMADGSSGFHVSESGSAIDQTMADGSSGFHVSESGSADDTDDESYAVYNECSTHVEENISSESVNGSCFGSANSQDPGEEGGQVYEPENSGDAFSGRHEEENGQSLGTNSSVLVTSNTCEQDLPEEGQQCGDNIDTDNDKTSSSNEESDEKNTSTNVKNSATGAMKRKAKYVGLKSGSTPSRQHTQTFEGFIE